MRRRMKEENEEAKEEKGEEKECKKLTQNVWLGMEGDLGD